MFSARTHRGGASPADSKKEEGVSGQRLAWFQEEDALRKVILIQALFRRRKARKILAKRKENAVYRANVAREIEKTEEDYVRNLDILLELFLKPLRQRMAEEKNDQTMTQFQSLFSDIQVIRNYNGNLLKDLKPRLQKWNPHQVIGDIFVQMSAFLKVYTQYVSRYNKAMVEFSAYKKRDPQVIEMLKTVSEKEEVGSQDINSFFIRPIQRIPRYRLLLKDLLKHTDEEHPDYNALSAALKQVSDVAGFIEEKASEAERMGKLLEVQSRLLGNVGSLAAPSRRYIREGRLAVGLPGDKVKKEHMVILFNDLLVDTKPVKKNGVEMLKLKNSYHLVQLYPVKLPEDAKEGRFGFALRADGDTVDVIRFFAASMPERERWVHDLSSVRQDIDAKRQQHNDLVLERAKQRASKAKLAFRWRYQTDDAMESSDDSDDGVMGFKPLNESGTQSLTSRENNDESLKLSHQTRWESRLKAHQERIRVLQVEDSLGPLREENLRKTDRRYTLSGSGDTTLDTDSNGASSTSSDRVPVVDGGDDNFEQPQKVTRKEKRSYRKTLSMDISSIRQLRRQWGTEGTMFASNDGVSIKSKPSPPSGPSSTSNDSQQSDSIFISAPTFVSSSNPASSLSATSMNAGDAVLSHKDASEFAAIPPPLPTSSSTRVLLSYLKKKNSEEKQKQSKDKDKEVISINPIRGIHLIPTFAAAAAAAQKAALASAGATTSSDRLSTSPPIIFTATPAARTTTSISTQNSPVTARYARSGSTMISGEVRQKKLRPRSMDFSKSKVSDLLRPEPEDIMSSLNEEWERRKKHLLEEWKKEDEEKERLFKAAMSQMKKMESKKARPEGEKDHEKRVKRPRREADAPSKPEQAPAPARRRPKSMEFSRKTIDDMLERPEETKNPNTEESSTSTTNKQRSGSTIVKAERSSLTSTESSAARGDEARSAHASKRDKRSDSEASSSLLSWLSASEADGLSLEEIDRRIADLQWLRTQKLTKKSIRLHRNDDAPLSSRNAEERQGSLSPSSQPKRSRERSHSSADPLRETSGSAIVRSDRISRKESKDKESDRTRDPDQKKPKDAKPATSSISASGPTPTRRRRPLSMDLSRYKPSDLLAGLADGLGDDKRREPSSRHASTTNTSSSSVTTTPKSERRPVRVSDTKPDTHSSDKDRLSKKRPRRDSEIGKSPRQPRKDQDHVSDRDRESVRRSQEKHSKDRDNKDKEKDRDRDRERDREKDRDREKEKEKDREKERGKDREREREKDKDKEKEKEKEHHDRRGANTSRDRLERSGSGSATSSPSSARRSKDDADAISDAPKERLRHRSSTKGH